MKSPYSSGFKVFQSGLIYTCRFESLKIECTAVGTAVGAAVVLYKLRKYAPPPPCMWLSGESVEPRCCLNIYYYYCLNITSSLKHFLVRLMTACVFFFLKNGSFTEGNSNTCVDTKLKQLTCIFSGDRETPHVTCILGVKSGPQILQKGWTPRWWLVNEASDFECTRFPKMHDDTVNPIALWKHAQKTVAVRHWNEWKSQGKNLEGEGGGHGRVLLLSWA